MVTEVALPLDTLMDYSKLVHMINNVLMISETITTEQTLNEKLTSMNFTAMENEAI